MYYKNVDPKDIKDERLLALVKLMTEKPSDLPENWQAAIQGKSFTPRWTRRVR